jgi:ketosteroid isomerase-like protein
VDLATNADLTRRGFEHWNERRFDMLLQSFHEEVVWDMSAFGIPDMAVFHGHEGMKRFFEEWLQGVNAARARSRSGWFSTTSSTSIVKSGKADTPRPTLRRVLADGQRGPGREYPASPS